VSWVYALIHILYCISHAPFIYVYIHTHVCVCHAQVFPHKKPIEDNVWGDEDVFENLSVYPSQVVECVRGSV
jgi:hypothetical protein